MDDLKQVVQKKLSFLAPYLLSFVLCYVLFKLIQRAKSDRKYPPGPIGLPILGYLPFLGKEPYKALHRIAKSYGNVFSLYLGQTYVVILGDIAADKDAFSQPSTVDRPPNLFDLLPGGAGFSETNGQEWVEQRRFSVRVMRDLGLGKGQWENLIKQEVENFISHLKKFNGESIDIFNLITSSVSNNIASLVLGKTLDYDDPTRNQLNEWIDTTMKAFSQAGLRNYFPTVYEVLSKLGFGGLGENRGKMAAFSNFISNHIKERITSPTSEKDFINFYLEEMNTQQQQNMNSTFTERNLLGNIQALMLAGTDTTAESLSWLLLAMVTNSQVLEKVQNELDSVLGPGNVASWEDRYKLPYTFATIMEGQRWRTLAPLNTSRLVQENIKICGYDIPKGTVIIANNWGIHNDTRYWSEPEKFRPERFLNSDNTLVTKPNSYVPFSYGKRSCPGETVAMMEILLYLSALLGNFDIRLAEKDQLPILHGVLGITYTPIHQNMRLTRRPCLLKS